MTTLSPYIPFLIIALVLAVIRFRIPSVKPDFSSTGILKVAAHFYTSACFTVAYCNWDWVPLAIGLALTGAEIFAFVVKPVEAQ